MPPADANEDRRLGWIKEANEDGENFLRNQRAWKDIDLGIDIISGEAYGRNLKGLSDLKVPMVKRDIREAVSTLSNMRPLWGYKTDIQELMKQNIILNKLLRAWYYRPFVREGFRAALQYALGCGLGWASPIWGTDSLLQGLGMKDIILEYYGPRDIRPYGISKDHDIQKCYVVTIRKEVPLQLAMIDFPTQLDIIVPTRGTPTWMKRGGAKVRRFLSPLLNAFGPGTGKDQPDTSPFPVVDIFHSYILDASVNMTETPIHMGEGSWAYTVPPYDSKIETGIYDQGGQPLFRNATKEDSRIYPLRRRVIWTDQGILKDDSSPYWHGMVPVVPFTGDLWAWDFLGYSMSHDGAPIEKSATRILRALDDSANVKLDAPLSYDEGSVSAGLMERFNPRKPGQRIKINAQQNDKPVQMIVPPDYYNVDAFVAGMPEKLYELMHYILGTRDIAALAKAKQVPSGDSIEKLMELAGPIVSDMSMMMEGSMVRLGEMWKGLAFQFYDMRRRVQVLGPDGVSEEDFDYDPADMIPSHLPDEFAKIDKHSKLAKINGVPYTPPESRVSRVERAKAHLQSFTFHVTPNSLHQITQLTKKMIYLQLWKGQFPIDPWSVAEAMDIDNYGSPNQLKDILGTEKIAEDKFGRWIAWRELLMKLAPPAPPKGRHPSGQTAPTPQSKDGGTRTTVRESPR